MGSKGNWFSSVKKAFSPNSKKSKKGGNKAKNIPFENEDPIEGEPPKAEAVEVSHPRPLPPPLEDVKLEEVEVDAEDEQSKHDYYVAHASAAAASAQSAAEVVRPATVSQFAGKSAEEVAAIKIQTAFRGYLARRALRALRGLVRLKSLVDGLTGKRQTVNTLKCMQTLSRVQSQIQSRRLRMLEENQALQRQLLQKRAKELETLRMGEDWDDSLQSKEQIEASMLHKYEAAMRRERALAYSYTHQQTRKKSARSPNLLFMDPTNPHWGWSWLERWMAARPWETTDKDPNNEHLSTKSAANGTAGEITKSFARHQLNSEMPSSPASQKPPSPATPSSKVARKLKPASSAMSQDEDSRSIFSVQSERNRRHSIAGSSVRDDESLGSSSSVPSYMATTKSAKAKSRLPSPLGLENGTTTPEKGSVGGSAKKRLSFPPSPARPRRHSGPPRVDTNSIAENGTNVEVS